MGGMSNLICSGRSQGVTLTVLKLVFDVAHHAELKEEFSTLFYAEQCHTSPLLRGSLIIVLYGVGLEMRLAVVDYEEQQLRLISTSIQTEVQYMSTSFLDRS